VNKNISRREWLKYSGLIGIGLTFSPAMGYPRSFKEDDYTTFFGDLHNHNMIGYAQGTLRRTYEIARNHLDFFAFTPHAHWHDISSYSGGIENKWINGFAVTKARWPEVISLAKEFDDPGKFITIAGYEWHSTSLGDYHILFPDLDADLALYDDFENFKKFALERGCLLIPHHPANKIGHRGANLKHLNSELSPIIEIYSEWGNAEHDRAPYTYKRHTEGGRWTKNTYQYFLSQGYRLGLIASTDDHLGYPGGYREGIAAIKATELTRESLFEAIRSKRTYGVTGDRIELDFWLNDHIMGQELSYTRNRDIRIEVEGWNQIDRIELLKNNKVIHRDFPMDRITSSKSWENPVILRFDYGWGPWPALGWNRTADWEFDIHIENGKLLNIHPCFTSGPIDENRRDKIVSWSESHISMKSYTSLKQQIDDYSQKAIIMKLIGGPETRIKVTIKQPAEVNKTYLFKDLAESNEPLFTKPFPWESAMMQRLVFQENYKSSIQITDKDKGERDNWYYVRVVQSNDQMAWSSPIWINKK